MSGEKEQSVAWILEVKINVPALEVSIFIG
jgi:hypothetical protein